MVEEAAVRHPERLALEFLARVWGSHDLDAIEELMTPEYVITSAGREIRGRAAFRSWVAEFHHHLRDARTESVEAFSNAAGDRVVSRWGCSGRNNGIFGLHPDGKPISFTGIAIWAVREGRLAECWVERSALEAYSEHGANVGPSPSVMEVDARRCAAAPPLGSARVGER
jgi:predicted ester cyclase